MDKLRRTQEEFAHVREELPTFKEITIEDVKESEAFFVDLVWVMWRPLRLVFLAFMIEWPTISRP